MIPSRQARGIALPTRRQRRIDHGQAIPFLEIGGHQDRVRSRSIGCDDHAKSGGWRQTDRDAIAGSEQQQVCEDGRRCRGQFHVLHLCFHQHAARQRVADGTRGEVPPLGGRIGPLGSHQRRAVLTLQHAKQSIHITQLIRQTAKSQMVGRGYHGAERIRTQSQRARDSTEFVRKMGEHVAIDLGAFGRWNKDFVRLFAFHCSIPSAVQSQQLTCVVLR